MKPRLDLFHDPVSPINNGDKSTGEFFAQDFCPFWCQEEPINISLSRIVPIFHVDFFSLFSMHLHQQLLCP